MIGQTTRAVLTIGHSTHTTEEFIALLQQHGVTAVADVRSKPYSRFNPQFNRENIEQRLGEYGIKYVFLGRELGARPDDPSCYRNGRIEFVKLASTDLFRSGIERVIRGASNYRLALMCAEKEPLECHRTVLVARALADRGITIEHILANGEIELHNVSLERLLDVVGLPNRDLFRTRQEMIAEALLLQEERIAYSNENLFPESAGESL
jgi:uncharacterized protein (DUF488 family)